jgi:AcrR family transcriptional regulator
VLTDPSPPRRQRRGDAELRRVLARAEAARQGTRRDGEAERPLGAKAARTRAQILRAAHDRFVADGYRTTSVPSISEAAGVGFGTFYQYFRDKADVMATLVGEAVIASTKDLLEAGPAEGGDWERASVESYVRGYEATADFQRVWEEVTHFEPELAAFRWDVTKVIDRQLERAIRRLQRTGEVHPDLDPVAAARALNAMADRYCYLTFVVEGRRGSAAVDHAVETLVRLRHAALRGGEDDR